MNTVNIIYNNTDHTVNITLANGESFTNLPVSEGWKKEHELLENGEPFNVKFGYRVNGIMVYA